VRTHNVSGQEFVVDDVYSELEPIGVGVQGKLRITLYKRAFLLSTHCCVSVYHVHRLV
jgi:hypothetical protein